MVMFEKEYFLDDSLKIRSHYKFLKSSLFMYLKKNLFFLKNITRKKKFSRNPEILVKVRSEFGRNYQDCCN